MLLRTLYAIITHNYRTGEIGNIVNGRNIQFMAKNGEEDSENGNLKSAEGGVVEKERKKLEIIAGTIWQNGRSR